MKTTPRGLALPALALLLLGLPISQALAADYTITTSGTVMTVTNNSNFPDPLAVSEQIVNSVSYISFSAPNRTFQVNGGATNNGGTLVSLSSITAITINGGNGGETFSVGGFSGTSFPSLTIIGGTGNDTVTFNGNIIFASNKSLTVNLQNGGGAHGTDAINVTGAHLTVSSNGTIDLECSQSVSITSGAVVQTELGTLTVMANQQNTPTTGNFIGVNLDGAGTKMQVVSGGGLTVNGRGGDSGDSQLGVNVSGGAQIVGGGLFDMHVTGTGGASTGIVNRGVTVYGAGSAITSTGARIYVTGTAGTLGSGFGIGVSVLYGGKISVGSGSSVFITGTGGGASGGFNQGVEIGGAATPVSTISAFSTVDVTATGGSGASVGLYLSDAAAIGPALGVNIHTDSISLNDTSSISTTNASSAVQIFTIAATHIDLGGPDALGTLGLSAAELGQISTPNLKIFGVGNGDLTISAPITLATTTNVSLSPGSGGLRATASGHDLILPVGGTLFLNGPLDMPITGPAADTNFPQLGVIGGVTLGQDAPASLNLAGTNFAGTAGQTFTILKNDGGAAINGTFDGLPEGALLTWPGSPLFYAQISYVGGSGHDVVLTLVNASANVTNNADARPYSLRAAIAYAGAHSGADTITFDPLLNGQTITLASQIVINDTAGVTIDASTLPNGLTISGGSFVPIAATGGGGIGATFGADWLIAAIDVTSGGSDYTSSPTVTVNPLYGSPTATASASLVTGKITAVNLTSGGSGYSSPPTIFFSGGGGTGASATATISNGVVSAINLTNGGSGYTSMPTINFSGGGGSGATAAVTTITNVVGSISVVNPGAGYTYVPPVTLSGGGGSGATGQAFLGLRLASIIASGSGYAVNDVLTFAGGSFVTAAQVKVTSISTGGHVTGVSIQTVGKYNTDPAVSGGNANGNFGLFSVPVNSTVALNNLTLANGGGSNFNGQGGALSNAGTLTATQCVFTGNSIPRQSGNGGAIYNAGTGNLTLNTCSLTNNSIIGQAVSGAGGAISNDGTMTLTLSTLNNNSAFSGGAILNNGTLFVRRCTLAANSAVGGSGQGGAIYSGANTLAINQSTLSTNSANSGGALYNAGGVLTLTNSIVAANTATTGADITNAATLNRVGANIVQGYSGNAPGGGGTFINSAPLLAPLDNYGGGTRTMALEPDSPARDAAPTNPFPSDQRFFPIVGTPDIGAYEAGTLGTNYNAYIWESLPVGATVLQHDVNFDYDGDGVTNFNEWLALTNPADPTSYLHFTQVTINGGAVEFTFPTVEGRQYTIQQSVDLLNWTTSAFGTFQGNGSPFLFGYLRSAAPKKFFRVLGGP